MTSVSDPYTSIPRSVDRLKREFAKYGKLVIGFDFDDTIFDYHNKGYSYKAVIQLLQRCHKLGFTMCLFTNEANPNRLLFKKDFCKYSLGFYPDYVNESPLLPGGGKPFFNILLDDRAGLGHAAAVLTSTVSFIESQLELIERKSKSKQEIDRICVMELNKTWRFDDGK